MLNKVQQRLHQFERLIVRIALTVIVLSLAGHILTTPLDHDEHMYLTAASLLSDHAIYRDFTYFQTPLMPYVYGAAVSAAGGPACLASRVSSSVGPCYLATLRLVKVLIVTFLALAIYGLLQRVTGSRWIALALLLFFVHNDVPRFTFGLARNYDLPLLLTVIATWLLLSPPNRFERIHASLPLVFAGALGTLAIGFKLTYAVVPLALGAALLLAGHPITSRLKHASWFILGGLIGLLPLLVIFLTTPRELFFFNNLGYHDLNTLWRLDHAPLDTMSLGGKLSALASELSDNNSLALLLVISAMLVLSTLRHRPVLARKRGSTAANDPVAQHAHDIHVVDQPPVHSSTGPVPVITRRSRLSRTVLALIIAGLAMILVPTPSLTSYYALLIFALTLSTASLFTHLAGKPRRYTGIAIVLIAAIMIISNLPRDLRNLAAVTQPGRWTGLQLYQQAQALRDIIPPGRPVFTLSPLYALEAGFPIYQELSAGVFGYRVAEYLPSGELEHVNLVSPQILGDFLDATPPSAILIGFEGELEDGIEAWAAAHGYLENRNLIPGARVYLAP